jgi:hypothetical protein
MGAPSAPATAARRRALARLARRHRAEFRVLLAEENARWQGPAAERIATEAEQAAAAAWKHARRARRILGQMKGNAA